MRGSVKRKPWPPWKKRGKRSTVKTVLDANVLISAAFGGVPALAVKRAFTGEVWISAETQMELMSVRRYLPKLMSQDRQLSWNATILPLISQMQKANVHHHLHISRDPKDDMYLSLAKTIKADFLVTGDKDLLTIEKKKLRSVGLESLRIVTPKIFLDLTVH